MTLPTVSHRKCLDEAFKALQDAIPAVGITDGAGKLSALIAAVETVGEVMMVQNAR